jgi:MFS family permease
MIKIFVNLLVPVITGAVYFFIAYQVNNTSKIRKMMFGDIGYKKIAVAFLLFGIYFITRPLQNVLGPHPWPMIINSVRQFFLMGIIAPAILVGILHWLPGSATESKALRIASYFVGIAMAVIFVLANTMAIIGSKTIITFGGVTLYDAVWASSALMRTQLTLIHLVVQLISPVGFFILTIAYIRHRRHTFKLSEVYTLMTKKWKYLEWSLIIIALSFIAAGLGALFGKYYTYLWVIYFIGALAAGLLQYHSIKMPLREPPADLK